MEVCNIAMILNILGNESRLLIFRELVKNYKKGLYPKEIASILNIANNTLSFHLSALVNVGLITLKKEGRLISYYPKCSMIQKINNFLLKECCLPNVSSKNEEEIFYVD